MSNQHGKILLLTLHSEVERVQVSSLVYQERQRVNERVILQLFSILAG